MPDQPFVTVVARDKKDDQILIFDLKGVPAGQAEAAAYTACWKEGLSFVSCHRAKERGGLRYNVKNVTTAEIDRWVKEG